MVRNVGGSQPRGPHSQLTMAEQRKVGASHPTGHCNFILPVESTAVKRPQGDLVGTGLCVFEGLDLPSPYRATNISSFFNGVEARVDEIPNKPDFEAAFKVHFRRTMEPDKGCEDLKYLGLLSHPHWLKITKPDT